MKEKTYVMVKPFFANYPEVVNEIKKRIYEAGLSILEESYLKYDGQTADRHYNEHVLKSWYPNLREYMTSDKVYGMVVEGEKAIAKVTALVGGKVDELKEGDIRYDIPVKFFGCVPDTTRNVVHRSSDADAAKFEIGLFHELTNESSNHIQ